MTGTHAKSPTAERWSRANADIERRATPREPVLLPALIVEAAGRRRPCVIVDRSLAGLRISLAAGMEEVPETFCVLDLVTGMGREVEVAWRRTPEMGLKVVRAYDLDQPQEGVGEVLRQIRIAVLG